MLMRILANLDFSLAALTSNSCGKLVESSLFHRGKAVRISRALFHIGILLLSSICFAQDIRRPISDVDGGNNYALGCSGQNQASNKMPLGYDAAGLATQSSLLTSGSSTTNFKTRIFSGWLKNVTVYTAVSLNVFATSVGWRNGAGLLGNSCAAYSTDAGNSWTSLVCDGGLMGGNGYGGLFSVDLSATQDISKIQVGVCTSGLGTPKNIGFGSDDIELYDVYTLGTTTPIAPSAGPAPKGQPHRGAVVVN